MGGKNHTVFQRLTKKDKTELDSIKKYHFGDLYREDLLYYGHTDIMVWTLPAQEETVLSHNCLSTSLDSGQELVNNCSRHNSTLWLGFALMCSESPCW